MKLSHFNVFIPTNNPGEYLLANMMSGAVVGIDQELKTALDHQNFDAIQDSLLDALATIKAVLPDHIDEYRIYKVEYDSIKHSVVSPNYTLVTTYSCNLDCPYCYQGKGEIFHGTMSDNTRKKTIQFIKNDVKQWGAQKFSVALYGGEPLIDMKGVTTIMDPLHTWAQKSDISYSAFIITNGTLITPDIAEVLHHYNTQYAQITLDGPKRIHDTKRVYKNGKGTFDDIIKGVHILRDTSIEVYFRINVDTETRKCIGELLDQLKEEGLHNIEAYMSVITPSQAGHNYSKCISKDEYKAVFDEFHRTTLQKGQKTRVTRHYEPSRVACKFLTHGTYVIDPYGDLYKCLTFLGQKEHCIGHINDNGEIENYLYSFYDWMSRDPLKIKECSTCKLLPSCGGGCAAVAYEKYGTYHACGCYEPFKEMEQYLRLYLEQNFPEKFKDGKIAWSQFKKTHISG
jgi:uncharacterized protein